ncbi:MAG: hypothetical protein BJ554DRAFT_6732, partial [Olpidium bornovanus]
KENNNNSATLPTHLANPEISSIPRLTSSKTPANRTNPHTGSGDGDGDCDGASLPLPFPATVPGSFEGGTARTSRPSRSHRNESGKTPAAATLSWMTVRAAR